MRPLQEPSQTHLRERVGSAVLTTSYYHPLMQVVLTILCHPPFAKEILHYFSTLFLEHSGGNFNSMIQKIRITNSESRVHSPRSFVARAIHQPSYSPLYQRARTHHTGFNCGINDRINDPIVTDSASRF